ncbi:MAG: hypothetical protein ISS19_13975 [Bacteroidales bacterium]|nr:hypothetical protein [Bacteroidales bacterium]
MKTQNSKRSVLFHSFLLIAALLFILFACSKTDKNENCNCGFGESTAGTLLLQLNETGYKIPFTSSIHENTENRYQYSRSYLDYVEFGRMFSEIHTVEDQISIVALIIYYKSLCEPMDTLINTDIIGYSIYYLKDSKLFHNVFLSVGTKGSYVEKFNYETNAVKSTQLSFILNYVSTFEGDKGYIIIFPNSILPFTLPNPRDEFMVIEQNYSCYIIPTQLKSSSSIVEIVPGAVNCGGECPIMQNNECIASPFPGDPDFCFYFCATDIQSKAVSDSNALSQDSIRLAYDTTLQYSLRDDFMVEYYIGQKYINYYHALSSFLGENSPSISLMVKTARLLIDFNSLFEMLLDPEEYFDDIWLTETLADELTDLIMDYKAISNNRDYQDILDDIIDDIELYEDMTLGDLLDTIE